MNWNNGQLTQAQINSAAHLLNSLRAEVFSRWNRWVDMHTLSVIGHNDVTPTYSGGSSRSCPRLPTHTNVVFPFAAIINLLNSFPILFPWSSVSLLDGFGDATVGMVENNSQTDTVLKKDGYYVDSYPSNNQVQILATHFML